MIEIFRLLPITTLLKCERVCNEWRSLLQSMDENLWRYKMYTEFSNPLNPGEFYIRPDGSWKEVCSIKPLMSEGTLIPTIILAMYHELHANQWALLYHRHFRNTETRILLPATNHDRANETQSETGHQTFPVCCASGRPRRFPITQHVPCFKMHLVSHRSPHDCIPW